MGHAVNLLKIKIGSKVFFRTGGSAVVRWIQRSSLTEDWRGLYFGDYAHCIRYSLSGEFDDSAGTWNDNQKHPFDIVGTEDGAID